MATADNGDDITSVAVSTGCLPVALSDFAPIGIGHSFNFTLPLNDPLNGKPQLLLSGFIEFDDGGDGSPSPNPGPESVWGVALSVLSVSWDDNTELANALILATILAGSTDSVYNNYDDDGTGGGRMLHVFYYAFVPDKNPAGSTSSTSSELSLLSSSAGGGEVYEALIPPTSGVFATVAVPFHPGSPSYFSVLATVRSEYLEQAAIVTVAALTDS